MRNRDPLYRFPAEIIAHAVWLYFRFPLSLRKRCFQATVLGSGFAG